MDTTAENLNFDFSPGLAAALADREALQFQESTGGVEPPVDFSPGSPATHVSPKASALIVNHETGGRAYYERIYKGRPVWPGAASGVTIGFGYDLGYYSAAKFNQDWAVLGAATLARLQVAILKHGGNTPDTDLKQLVQDLSDISISWDTAEEVFKVTTLPTFASMTWDSLPNCDQLSDDCFGVLVSLTFNRGNSYNITPAKDPSGRYTEMRAIKQCMTDNAFDQIPGLIRSMERIWKGTTIATEMTKRREEEAALFETGLAGA